MSKKYKLRYPIYLIAGYYPLYVLLFTIYFMRMHSQHSLWHFKQITIYWLIIYHFHLLRTLDINVWICSMRNNFLKRIYCLPDRSVYVRFINYLLCIKEPLLPGYWILDIRHSHSVLCVDNLTIWLMKHDPYCKRK